MSSSDNKKKINYTKFLIPLLLGGSVAYIVYRTYRQSQRQQANKTVSDVSDVSESLRTEWIDYDDVGSTANLKKLEIDLDGKIMTDRRNLMTPSLANVAQEKNYQETGFKSLNQSQSSLKSESASASANEAHYDKESELNPAIPHMPHFQRRISVPKLMAPKHFLGESSYRETVIFLLACACYRLFPDQQLVVENTFKFGIRRRSYLCRFTDRVNGKKSLFEVDADKLHSVKQEVKKLVQMKLELHSKFVDYHECLQMLTITNQLYSAKLIQTLNRPCYRMVGVDIDNKTSYYILQYRSTLNNTKYCSKFRLHTHNQQPLPNKRKKVAKNFILLFPHHDDLMDDDLDSETTSSSNLLHVSQDIDLKDEKSDISSSELNLESKDENEWNQPKAISDLYQHGLKMSKMLDVKCVADINIMIQSGRFKELMLLAESYHNRQIVKISTDINKQYKTLKIILISGPSSSGKTTFASKLGIQLRLLGFIPTVLEVDMFFKDRTDPTHPRDKKGNLNFEVIESLKIEEFNESIKKLIGGGEIRVPKFDFTVGARRGYNKEALSLDADRGILIMEGIFCLNPDLWIQDIVPNVEDVAFKIFICPISPFFSLDNFHFISEQVTRLVRRISRDHFHRGKKPDETVFKWGQLKEGEDINIFPFVKHADAVFNSSLAYELSVLKVYSYPLLQTVSLKSKQYKDAQNLLSFLDCFLSMPDSSVPSDSLLMEFIGNSIFDEL